MSRRSKPPRESKAGYGRPPTEHRFQPGRSGNPKGRPKKRDKDLNPVDQPTRAFVLEELYRPITISEGGEQVQIPAVRAVIRKAMVTALKGSSHAQSFILKLLDRVETEARDSHLTMLLQALRAREALAEYRERAGLPEDHLAPHPRDIAIDPTTGIVTIYAPLLPDSEHGLRAVLQLRVEAEADLRRSQETMGVEGSDALLEFGRELALRKLDNINQILPPRFRRSKLPGIVSPPAI